MEIVLAIILGTAFGFALYIVGASSPRKLLSMLRLQDLSLMKIILGAIGFSSVLLSIALMLGIFDVSHIHIKTTNLGVIIGGVIFGLGFGSVGTCPGTCLTAFGTPAVKRAIAAVIGGLTGAFIFTITYGWWKGIGLFDVMDLGKLTLFQLTENSNSVFSIGPAGLLITGGMFMLISLIIPMYGRRKS